ncbi:response regulator [Escherichia coli]|nr:response regulator [Salmonella enterica subsp. enterica]EFG2885738.1 response regulator [Escherichia coli]
MNHSGLHGARILIVEDEFLIAMDIEEICLEWGAESVHIAKTVAELADADLGKFDLAVLDRSVGLETSHGVARRLAANGTPFIFTSGFPDDGELAEFPDAPFVGKPYSTERLLEALSGVMSKARPAQRVLDEST